MQHLSHSSLSVFNRCSWEWKLKYRDRLPTVTTPALVFGTAIHNALEQAIRPYAGDRVTDESPLPIWQAAWDTAIARGPVTWEHETPEQVFSNGYRLFASDPVQDLIPTLKPLVDDDGPLIERKIEIRLPGVPVPIIGFIDLVMADGVPVDFKTASRPWTQKQAEQEVQPLYYHIGLTQARYRGNPDLRFRHIVLVKGDTPRVQILETRHTPLDLFRLCSSIQDAWTAIDLEQFTQNFDACRRYGRMCDYSARCMGLE